MSPTTSRKDGAAAHGQTPSLMPEAGAMIGLRVGNYVIERPLARGGMGSVFVARHPHLGKEVAVKFLELEVSTRPELGQRFLAEARITANLNHPNIVDIFDFGELDGRLYYVMELLRGRSLRAAMQSHGRFTLAELLPFMEQVCSALEAAHAAGVVHRDMKPGNVFVLEGATPRVKLLDFGVAKLMAAAENKTRHGQVLGTASHMAPEQALGDVDRITPQSDLYSLGVIVYEMLTGVPLFRHESDLMLMVMHVRDRITPIRELVPEIPQQVAAVIEACLAKSPQERPESARALVGAFRDAVHGVQALGALSLPLPQIAPLLTDATSLGSQATLHDSDVRMVSAEPLLAPREDIASRGTVPSRQAEPLSVKVDSLPLTAPSPPQFKPAAAVAVARPIPSPPVAPAPVAFKAPVVIAAPEAPKAPAVATPPAATAVESPRALEPQLAPAPHSTTLHNAPAIAQPVLPAPPAPEAPPPVAERDDAPLTATAQQTLSKLLARLQRKGDFPAFAQSVGEVSKKADANSAYSASQLGDSILKDYALTAKLLKVVNSMYASRFGGKVYSVQHAIVLLGFDRIRSLALGISLFKGAGKNAQSPYVTDSAISSLVSGEIARALAWNAKLSDEEALVCAMFRNLGRHLVIVYLPETFEQIVALAQRDNLHERTAAERVLGISYGKLGVAVAQNWKLPPRMISAIAAAAQTGALTRAEDRVSALSALANDLCDVVAASSATTRSKNIGDLLLRHKQLLTVSEDSVLELLANVQESFQQRYATLGLDVKASRFLNNVGALLEEREAQAAAAAAAAAQAVAAPPEDAEAASLPAVFGAPAPAAGRVDLLERPRPVIAKLNLAKELAADSAGIVLRQIPQPTLEQQIDEVAALLQRRMPVDSVLGHALNTFATQLGVTRLLLLVASSNKDELWVRSGMREDIEAVAKELKIPLKSRGPANLFAQAYQSGKDVAITDAFTARTNGAIPVRYYEVLGAPAFALYSCVGKSLPPALLLADVDSAEALPSAERVAPLARLRALIAQAAASR